MQIKKLYKSSELNKIMKRGRKKKEKREIKRGLSTVLVMLIIILVSLIAMGIIWIVVRNVVKSGSEQISVGQFTLKAEIMNVNLDNFSNDITLSVKRKQGEGEFNKLNFVFSDGENMEVITEIVSLNELEEKKFNFYLNNLSVSNLTSISIVPVLKQGSKETIGNVLDEYQISQADFFQAVLQMNFFSPTPVNGLSQSENNVYINVSTYDANNHSAFIDWDRSLVGWWNFESVNPTNGVVLDSSTWGNNGTLINHATNTTIAGARGRALDFDGINDYVNVSYNQNLNITNEMTVEAWFYQKFYASWKVVLNRDDGVNKRIWTMRTITYNNFSFTLWNRSSSPVTATRVFLSAVNNWHHAAAVYNSTAVVLYVDGISGVPVDLPGGIRDANTPLYIAPYWNGSIDEVKIFSRALTPEEINASYQAGIYRLYRNFTNIASGSHTYRAWLIDSLGNIGERQRSVTIL